MGIVRRICNLFSLYSPSYLVFAGLDMAIQGWYSIWGKKRSGALVTHGLS